MVQKMKRQRESDIAYEIKDTHVVLTSNGRHYAWHPPIGNVCEFLNEKKFSYEIIYNDAGQALFSVEDMRTNTDILRMKIDLIELIG